ncbi:MAG: putative quinol monooxygenase [Paracoccus sp. (in: a-proteobacteria)]
MPKTWPAASRPKNGTSGCDRAEGYSRGEAGCLDYGYFRQGDEFTSIEYWADAEAEAAHNDTDFLREILRDIQPLLDGRPSVMRWTRRCPESVIPGGTCAARDGSYSWPKRPALKSVMA